MLKRFWFIFSILVFPLVAFGQDLGSSNGLFRSSNPPSKSSSSSKKTTPKPKPAPEKSAVKKETAKKETPKKETVKKETARKETPKRESSKSTAKNSPKSTTYDKTGNSKIDVAKINPTPKPTVQPTPIKVAANRPPINENKIIYVGQTPDNNSEELYEQAIDEGNTARDERNYKGAETAYRRAQSLRPGDSRAIYGLGNLYSDQQRWEEAENAYREAIRLEPNSPEAHIALSFVLTQPVLGSNLGDRYALAQQMARKAIMLDNNNPVAHDQLGVALELSGIIEQETQNSYLKAVQLDPSFALAYAHLGRLYRRNGMINESETAYKNAINNAQDVPTMILVAEVMQSQQRYAPSEQLLRRALREDPKNPTALFLLGKALTIGNKYDEAEKVLKTSLEVSPNSFVSYTYLSSLYTRRNQFENAETILMKALQVISVNERRRLAQEFELVGDGYLRVGKKIEAARVYRQALALDGNKPQLTGKLNRVQKG